MGRVDPNLDKNSVMNTNVWPRRCPARVSTEWRTH